MNQVIFVGRLVRSLELKQINEGTTVLHNTIAINRPVRNQHGEEITDFIPFVVWNRLAEIMAKYCRKGDQIAIAGRMQSRSYEVKDQKTVYVVECVVTDLTLLSNPQRLSKEGQKKQKDEENMLDLTFEDKNQIADMLSGIKEKGD